MGLGGELVRRRFWANQRPSSDRGARAMGVGSKALLRELRQAAPAIGRHAMPAVLPKKWGANELICNKVSPWHTMPDGVMQRFVGDLPQGRDVRSR
jgi:hypothetical protein